MNGYRVPWIVLMICAFTIEPVASAPLDSSQFQEINAGQNRKLIEKPAFTRLDINEDPESAIQLSRMAAVCVNKGEYGKAEKYLKKSLLIRERELGPCHPLISDSVSDLAFVLCSQGKFLEAEPLYLRAVAIDEQVFGSDSFRLARSLEVLGTYYFAQGEYAKAKLRFQQVMTIIDRDYGDIKSLDNRAEIKGCADTIVMLERMANSVK